MFMCKVRGEWADWIEMTVPVISIATRYNQGMQNSISEQRTQNPSRSEEVVQHTTDHVRRHSCQLRTRHTSYRPTKMGNMAVVAQKWRVLGSNPMHTKHGRCCGSRRRCQNTAEVSLSKVLNPKICSHQAPR